jgi:hypothetical protein
MALETTFRQLSVSLQQLHDALNAVHVTVGDQPSEGGTAFVDGLENGVLDMLGILHEARRAALHARRAVAPLANLDQARRALTTCQERFHQIQQQFAKELVSYEKLAALARLGNERRAWMPWANIVKQEIEECREPIDQSSRSLAACWEELAERLGMVNLSVHTIGQQIKMPAKATTLEPEGVT